MGNVAERNSASRTDSKRYHPKSNQRPIETQEKNKVGCVLFRGDEYPIHFVFQQKYQNGEIKNGTVVGNFVFTIYINSSKILQQHFLIWTGTTVMSIEAERYISLLCNS